MRLAKKTNQSSSHLACWKLGLVFFVPRPSISIKIYHYSFQSTFFITNCLTKNYGQSGFTLIVLFNNNNLNISFSCVF